MRQRQQHGTIVVINNRWYLRYYQRQTVGGMLTRKRTSTCLGPVTTRGRRPPDAIEKAAEAYMRTINDCPIPAQQVVGIGDFIENVYLPRIEQDKRPSTYKGYRDIWRKHLKPVVSREHLCLKDVRTVHVQKWLDQIGKENLGKNTLAHIKATLSGIFRYAKQLDYYDKPENPVREASINSRAPEPGEMYAYSLEEIYTILSLLPTPSDVVFAIAAYAGLRFAELQGLDWADFRDSQLWISRNVWNGHVGEPKTKKSKAPVPVIHPLSERLELYRLRCGNPGAGPMFANSIGGRLNLNNLLARTMLPALNRCLHCGGEEGKTHLKQNHEWKRDDRIPIWHGWHAARRGLASNLNRLGVDDSVIQRILRHSNVAVTQTHYIKTTSLEVQEAMGKLEKEITTKTAAQALRDSDRTVKLDSGATPESVN